MASALPLLLYYYQFYAGESFTGVVDSILKRDP
jgi:hypothetical protein